MAAKGTQYQLPLVAKLVKNREEQRAADAQKNSEERDHDPVMEWVRVFFSVFWLSLLSGSFLFVWVFALKLAGF